MIIQNVYKAAVKPFVNALNDALEVARTSRSGARPTGTTIDIADQLRKLGDLKQQGILTEEEFLAQKKKLLAA